MNAFERELQQLEQDLENGEITIKEYNRLLRDMEADYISQAQQEAQEAYDYRLQNWGME